MHPLIITSLLKAISKNRSNRMSHSIDFQRDSREGIVDYGGDSKNVQNLKENTIAIKYDSTKHSSPSVKFKNNLAASASQILTQNKIEYRKTPINDNPYKMPKISKNSSYLQFKSTQNPNAPNDMKMAYKNYDAIASGTKMLSVLNKTIAGINSISFNRYKRNRSNIGFCT